MEQAPTPPPPPHHRSNEQVRIMRVSDRSHMWLPPSYKVHQHGPTHQKTCINSFISCALIVYRYNQSPEADIRKSRSHWALCSASKPRNKLLAQGIKTSSARDTHVRVTQHDNRTTPPPPLLFPNAQQTLRRATTSGLTNFHGSVPCDSHLSRDPSLFTTNSRRSNRGILLLLLSMLWCVFPLAINRRWRWRCRGRDGFVALFLFVILVELKRQSLVPPSPSGLSLRGPFQLRRMNLFSLGLTRDKHDIETKISMLYITIDLCCPVCIEKNKNKNRSCENETY